MDIGHSKRSLSTILNRSLNETLKMNLLDESWEIVEFDTIEQVTLGEFYMLTISAVCSRFIILLHFNGAKWNTGAIANKLSAEVSEVDNKQIYDYVAELGNIFAGTIKRYLTESLPYTGLSVPSLMNRDTSKYIQEVSFDWDSHFSASVGDTEFCASVFVNCGEDLQIKEPALIDDSHANNISELELF